MPVLHAKTVYWVQHYLSNACKTSDMRQMR